MEKPGDEAPKVLENADTLLCELCAAPSRLDRAGPTDQFVWGSVMGLRLSAGRLVCATRDGLMRSFRWDEIREIAAYKIDLFSIDEVCLGFRFREEDEWVEVRESEPDFRRIVDSLPEHFPSIPDGWQSRVMFPAFAECRETLFKAD